MTLTITAVTPTGVPHTSAAHLVADHRYDQSPITVVWSTTPVACIDWLLGDDTSQGPVHYPASRVPTIRNSSRGLFPDWYAATEVRCGVCGQMIGPWALVRDGHLVGDELTNTAREVAKLATEEREYQRRKLIAALTPDAERLAHGMADHILRVKCPIVS